MISTQVDSGSEDYQSLTNEDLTKIEDTRQDWPHGYGQPMELVFGKKFQLEVFEECLKSMLVDEVSKAFVSMCDWGSLFHPLHNSSSVKMFFNVGDANALYKAFISRS